jgi:hypothetical protein
MSALLAAALAYARQGWPVLALHSVRDGECSCSKGRLCDRSPGKHPRTAHGLDDATREADRIRRLWSWWPDANIGLRCDHLFILDIDPRNGGDLALAELERKHGPLQTRRIRTGGGGPHLYMTAPPGPWRKQIGPGLDIQAGPGKYVLAPPSSHLSGGIYHVEVDTPIAEAPAWLVEMARRPAVVADRGPIFSPPATCTPALADRVRAWLARRAPAIEGQHGHDWTFLTAAHVVHGFQLGDDDAFALLAEWNARCEPPWSEADLARKVREARTRGTSVAWGQHGKTRVSSRPPPHTDDEAPPWLR